MPQIRRRRSATARQPEAGSPAAVAAAPVTQLQSIASYAGNTAFSQHYAASMGDLRLVEHRDEVLARLKIDLARAKKQNEAYARVPDVSEPSALGWGERLGSVKGAEKLAELWKAGRRDEFAHAVAALQVDLGVREADVDGVLGPSTWARIGGLGEAMAGIGQKGVEGVEQLCYEFSERRMRLGHQRATGKPVPVSERDADFNRIISSSVEGSRKVDEQYRATGAAGALVYSGLGDFVPEADIWSGSLRPGATLQVFKHKEAYDLLKRAGTKDKTRERLGDKEFFNGTSYVFVRYDPKSNERMLVRHWGDLEWHSRSDWAVWVAANTREPGRP